MGHPDGLPNKRVAPGVDDLGLGFEQALPLPHEDDYVEVGLCLTGPAQIGPHPVKTGPRSLSIGQWPALLETIPSTFPRRQGSQRSDNGIAGDCQSRSKGNSGLVDGGGKSAGPYNWIGRDGSSVD